MYHFFCPLVYIVYFNDTGVLNSGIGPIIGHLLHIELGFFSSFLLYYTTPTERFATKLGNFIIRYYIQMSIAIRSIVWSLYT